MNNTGTIKTFVKEWWYKKHHMRIFRTMHGDWVGRVDEDSNIDVGPGKYKTIKMLTIAHIDSLEEPKCEG